MLEKQNTSHGFKFEQYMTSDHPSREPDTERPLNECEEFHFMFKAKFDEYSLLYGAEIDCIFSQQPITNTLIDKTFQLIELKTLTVYSNNINRNINRTVSRERVTMWWSQNYLVQTDRIILGLKDRDKKVKKIKEYSIPDLLKLSRQYCNIDDCKIFCKIFLDNVKRIVTKDHNECMYKFHWKPIAKDIVNYSEEAPNHKRYFFLKKWFVDVAEKEYRKRFLNNKI